MPGDGAGAQRLAVGLAEAAEAAGRISILAHALRLAYQCAKAINFLHKLDPPVLHSDVKSLNFLVTEQLTVKVADFGLSRIRHESTSMQSTLPQGGPLLPAVCCGWRLNC